VGDPTLKPDRVQELFDQVRDDASLNAQSRLLYVIHEVSRLISTRFDQSMVRHRITHVQWWAMMHIGENEGATQSEFANLMQMGRAPAGKLLERLEQKGWIERRSDAADNRVRRIYLAEGATPVFEAMTVEARVLFSDLLGNLPGDEVVGLLEGLLKIKQNLGKPLRD
jgi:DNA-binding MarR family transcriptional regulator